MERLKNMRREWYQSIRSLVSGMDNEYHRMKMVLMIFKLLGLAPWSIDRPSTGKKVLNLDVPRSSPQPKLVYSRLGCAYNVVLVVIVVGLWIVTFPRLYSRDYPNKSRVTVTIEVIFSVSATIIVTALRLIPCIKRDTAIKLFNLLTTIDRDVARVAHVYNSEPIGPFVVILFVAEGLLWVVVVLSTHWCVDDIFGPLVNTILPTMTMCWLLMQYVIMVKLIERRFRVLNRALLDSLNHSVIRWSPSLIIGDNPLHYPYSPKILTFRKFHAKLYKIACEISDFYSIPTLLSIVRLGGGIVYTLYMLVIPLVLQGKWNPPCMNIRMLSWLVVETIPIIMLTAGIDRTNFEMSKTADVVHKVLARGSTSPQDKAELRVFSLELFRRNVEFTACGLFTINCALLHSIFSSAVMYATIVIQLQLAGAKKSANISESSAE